MSGKLTQIIGERINQRNIKEIYEKLNTGVITIEKANGMSEEKLYELGILALYTRVTNMQSGNHVVTKDEVISKSKKYMREDMTVRT